MFRRLASGVFLGHGGGTSPQRSRELIPYGGSPSPLMSYRGLSNWPPMWTKADSSRATVRGEIGTLTQVILSCIAPYKRCYLLIDYRDESYLGTLLFEDAVFCRQIHDLLQQHLGESIRYISNIGLRHLL